MFFFAVDKFFAYLCGNEKTIQSCLQFVFYLDSRLSFILMTMSLFMFM